MGAQNTKQETGNQLRGAEAVVRREKFMGMGIMVKERIPKNYRITALDARLRRERTRMEARLLHRAKLAGVGCPVVFFVDEFSIGMGKIGGKRPRMDARECAEAGRMLGKLHNAGIMHGDFTPANLISGKEGISAIDFGLGFLSQDVEDKAVDVLTMLKAIRGGEEAFLSGYCSEVGNAEKIRERIGEVKARARYS